MGIHDMRGLRDVFRPADLLVALGLLTRLPVPFPHATARAPAAAAWAYPLVGLVVGGIAVLVGGLAQNFGMPPPVTAIFVLTSLIMLTGAMHEDGLADCADGFWGGWEAARRLEIMKDSQVGTYGVLALILSLLLRWSVVVILIENGALAGALLAAAVMSRAGMVGVMAALPNARRGGLSAQTGQPGKSSVAVAMLLAGVAAFLAPGGAFIWLVCVASLTGLTAALIARAKIGGQTGDVLGATQQLVEIAVLYTVAAVILGSV